MTLRVITASDPRCFSCGQSLPERVSGRIPVGKQWSCPRCFYLDKWNIAPGDTEIRSVKGRSSIVVPRIEFHIPTQAPSNALDTRL